MDAVIEAIRQTYWKEIQKKPNVKGYSGKLQNKEKDGVLIPKTFVFRVYVSKKVPANELKPTDLVPRLLALKSETIETDVYEVQDVKALTTVDKTAKFDTVPLGVSIGHWDITAGSLGMLYRDRDGHEVAGSNAHVLTPDPSLNPDQVIERKILQPGPYHGGQTVDNQCGYYVWHQKILPLGISPCPLGNGLAKISNFFLKLLRRQGRFQYTSTSTNLIDFGVYKILRPHVLNTADGCLQARDAFIGHLFAGSDTVGVICKVQNIINQGYTPKSSWFTDPKEGDVVRGCSFWCHYETTILDTDAVLSVGYGSFTALFTDVILVKNDGTIKGGWSGSGWFKVAPY